MKTGFPASLLSLSYFNLDYLWYLFFLVYYNEYLFSMHKALKVFFFPTAQVYLNIDEF